MSQFFFCCACGHNLTYISQRRLKCYGCKKYFTENFICGCPKHKGFKFSAEIIAPNKVKCFFCGQEAEVPATLVSPYKDRRDATESKDTGLGGWDGEVSSFQPVRKPKPKRQPAEWEKEQKVPEIEKPEVDYVSEDRIIIRFPGHQRLDQIYCQINNDSGTLEVKSLLVDFSKEFPLPDFPIKFKADLKNAILDIKIEVYKKRTDN